MDHTLKSRLEFLLKLCGEDQYGPGCTMSDLNITPEIDGDNIILNIWNEEGDLATLSIPANTKAEDIE